MSKTNDGAYVKSLSDHESIGTNWIALHLNAENVSNFEIFGVEYIPKEIKKFIENKNIATNIYGMQA